MSDPNVDRGSSLTLQIRNDADTAWELAGGVKDLSYNMDSPVDDTTSSSTITDFAESQFTGFSQLSVSISGVEDSRSGITDPITGLNIVSSARLLEVAFNTNRCGKFRIFNVTTSGFIEGNFNVTAFSKSAPVPGLMTYEATLQSASDITISGSP